MILVPIAPPSEVGLLENEPVFAFAELVHSNALYRQQMRMHRHTVFLDSMVYEGGEPISDEAYVEAAQMVHADYCFVPDVPFDKDATLQRYIDILPKILSNGQGMPIGILQGTNMAEVLHCAEVMTEGALDYLAIPVRLPRRVGAPRWYIAHAVYEHILRLRKKRIRFHFLGIGPWSYMDELSALGYVRTLDTAAWFNLGWHGVHYSRATEDALKRPPGFFDLEVEPSKHNLYRSNLYYLKALLATPTDYGLTGPMMRPLHS